METQKKSGNTVTTLFYKKIFRKIMNSRLLVERMGITNVSAGRLGGLFGLNRTDSGLVGRDRSDPAAHANH